MQLHAQIQIFEGQDIGVDQVLDFNFQRETVLNVMTLCPLMEGIKDIRSPTSRQFLWYRLRSTFEPLSLEQSNAQYHDQVSLDGKHK